MTTVVVVVVVAVLLLAATADGSWSEPPSREQLDRDTEDIALYGAVVRPPLDDDEHRDDGAGTRSR